MAKDYGFQFAMEVAPPELVLVVRRKATKVLDTIEEEEAAESSSEDVEDSSEMTPAGSRPALAEIKECEIDDDEFCHVNSSVVLSSLVEFMTCTGFG
ncbi:hypothetical protein Cni_G27002 [Canna indica]|uniref:Uncharacterized protein n=1 Tax=Canna indica TaxID=4628 RepID=A0AAQ3QNW3_9LILI|nr:hypothetical protein Cni_G27002 [Canna indica]